MISRHGSLFYSNSTKLRLPTRPYHRPATVSVAVPAFQNPELVSWDNMRIRPCHTFRRRKIYFFRALFRGSGNLFELVSCFEDIYRIQTAWKVPDPQLRKELRISISEKVIPPYRSFMGRFGSHLQIGRHAGKYIKYSPEDLENYLLDLFEGMPLILHHLRRKST